MDSDVMISKNIVRGEDPLNAALREIGLNSRPDPMLMVPPLIQMTEFLHLSWLFVEKSKPKNLLKILCQKLSSYHPETNGSWYHFGGCMDLEWQSLEVIRNHDLQMDKTEFCLRVIAQSENVTLKSVIETFVKLERFDAISSSKEHIENLYTFIHSEKGRRLWETENYLVNNDHDSGFNSLPDSTNSDNIIRPKDWRILFMVLPLSLKHNDYSRDTDSENENENGVNHQVIVHTGNHQQAVATPRETKRLKVKRKKNILLTFANDGRHAAERIASVLRGKGPKRKSYGVVILDENAHLLLRRLDAITTIFRKVDFVMPILTPGYFDAISNQKKDPETLNALAPLDNKYAQHIYKLMQAEFTMYNSFCNERFRCIIPSETSYTNIQNRMQYRLELNAWTNESEIEEFARRLL